MKQKLFLLLLLASFPSSSALTVTEGRAVGARLLSRMTEGFAMNSIETLADELIADEIEYAYCLPHTPPSASLALTHTTTLPCVTLRQVELEWPSGDYALHFHSLSWPHHLTQY